MELFSGRFQRHQHDIITLYKYKAIAGIATAIMASCFCVLLGKFLLISSCPESTRLLTEFYLRVCGFCPSRSTPDIVFSLRQLQEKFVEQSHPLYVVFIDLTKAFHAVSWSNMYNIFCITYSNCWAVLKHYFPSL